MGRFLRNFEGSADLQFLIKKNECTGTKYLRAVRSFIMMFIINTDTTVVQLHRIKMDKMEA